MVVVHVSRVALVVCEEEEEASDCRSSFDGSWWRIHPARSRSWWRGGGQALVVVAAVVGASHVHTIVHIISISTNLPAAACCCLRHCRHLWCAPSRRVLSPSPLLSLCRTGVAPAQ